MQQGRGGIPGLVAFVATFRRGIIANLNSCLTLPQNTG